MAEASPGVKLGDCTVCGEPLVLTTWGPAGSGGVCRDPWNPNDDDEGQHVVPCPPMRPPTTLNPSLTGTGLGVGRLRRKQEIAGFDSLVPDSTALRQHQLELL